MNGGIVGKMATSRSGVWSIDELLTSHLKFLANVPSQATIWDSLNSGTGRTFTNITGSSNTVNFKEGGAALNIIKTSTTKKDTESFRDSYSPSLNLTGKHIGVLLYIQDAATLAKISAIRIRVGQNGTNFYGFNFLPSLGELHTGWQRLEGSMDAPEEIYGSPNKTAIDCNILFLSVVNATDVFAGGSVIFDALYYY